MALNLGDIIVRLGLDTGQFTREMRAAQRSLQGAGAGFQQVGTAATAAVTLPLLAAAGASLKFAADFDSAMTQSTAIMAEFSNQSELTASGQEALRAELEMTGRSVAKDLNLAAADAGRAFFYLTSAGLDAQQSIAALPQVAAFAKAGMFDFALATDLATDAQSALGLSVDDEIRNLENLTRVTDVLVKANTLANATVEQFSKALTTKAGAALKVANKSIEEGVAVLAAFADQGIKSENAGTALNIVLRELTTKAIKNSETFDALGVSVFNAEGNLNNMADIVGDLEQTLDGMSDAQKKATLLQLGFTDKSVIFIQTLLGQSKAIREYQQSLEEAGGTTKDVAERQLEAFNEQVGLVTKRLVDAGITIGQALIPIVLDLLEAMDPVVEVVVAAAEAFGELPKPIQIAVVALGALAAAIGPVLIVAGFLAQSVASLIAIWPVLTAAVAGFTTFVTGTAIPALANLATTLAVALAPAIAVVVTAFAAFELTRAILEATGLAEKLDDLADSLFNVQRNAEGFAVPSFLSEQDLRLIELAEEKLGTVFARTPEGLKAAQAAMNDFNTALRMGVDEADAASVAERAATDATGAFAQAVGITKGELEQVAQRLGMTTDQLILDKNAIKLTRDELEKLNAERDRELERLRGLVETHADVQAAADDLALAVQLEGGAIALTNAETMRISEQVSKWNEENVKVAASLEEVVKRAQELAKAENMAAIQAGVVEAASTKVGLSQKELEKDLEGVADEFDHTSDAAVPAFENMRAGLSEHQRAALESADRQAELNKRLEEAREKAQKFEAQVQALANIFQVLGISAESTLGTILGSLGAAGQFGAQIQTNFLELQGLFAEGGGIGSLLSEQGLEAGIGMAEGVVGGAAAVWSATSKGGAAAIFGGAAAGAKLGAQIGGPIGAGFGAAIGAAIGGVRHLIKTESEKIAADIERDWGIKISEELAKAMEKAQDELDIGRFESRLLFLGDVIAEAGGAAAFGLEQTADATIDLMNAIALGSIPAEEGLAEVGEVFGLLAEEAVAAGEIADASLLMIIQRSRELGQEIPEIAEFVRGQLETAAEGVAAIIGTAMESETGEITFGGIQANTVEDAQAQATIFAGAFFATLEEQGLLAAVDAFGPAFEEMKAKFEEFGSEVDFGGVARFFQLAEDPEFRPLLEGIQGLNDAMVGMANAGYLTADSFAAFQQQGGAAFDQLIEKGLSQNQALQQMAPFIQSAIDASEKFGYPLDENTLRLKEQAEAAGIAFTTDPMQRMVDVLEIVAMKLGATAEELGLVGDEGQSAGDDAAKGMEEMANSAETATEETEKTFEDMAMSVGDDFLTMQEGAEENFKKVGESADNTAESVRGIGEAAQDAAKDFDDMARSAGDAASAADSATSGGPPGGGDHGEPRGMAEGGLVTRPTFTLLGEDGPELVLPLKDLNEATSRPGPGLNASDLMDMMQGGMGQTSINLNMILDTEALGRVVYRGTKGGSIIVHPNGVREE